MGQSNPWGSYTPFVILPREARPHRQNYDAFAPRPARAHLSLQKVVSQFIIALLKSCDVQFCEVAQRLNDAVKVVSDETRIQDFSREVDLKYLVLAQLLLTLLPATGKLRLWRLNRTEWDFGRCQVNIGLG